MFMVVRKKHISIVLIIALFITGVIINIQQNDAEDFPVAQLTIKSDGNDTHQISGEAMLVNGRECNIYIDEAKNDRDVIRSKALEILNNTIKDVDVSEETQKAAEERILEIASNIETEVECEKILAAKGFKDSVVFISDDVVNVTIAKKIDSKDEIVKINDVIYEQTGNNNIKIVEVM